MKKTLSTIIMILIAQLCNATISQTQFEDMMEKSLTPFRQVVQGSNTITIVADTESTFISDGLALNEVSGPSYMTNRFDTTYGKMKASSEYDSPTYMAEINFIWTPSSSNSGEVIVRLYVYQDPQADPIRTYRRNYSGESADPYSFNTFWYWGTDDGFDAKNNGVFWTVEFEHNGSLTVPTIIINNVN